MQLDLARQPLHAAYSSQTRSLLTFNTGGQYSVPGTGNSFTRHRRAGGAANGDPVPGNFAARPVAFSRWLECPPPTTYEVVEKRFTRQHTVPQVWNRKPPSDQDPAHRSIPCSRLVMWFIETAAAATAFVEMPQCQELENVRLLAIDDEADASLDAAAARCRRRITPRFNSQLSVEYCLAATFAFAWRDVYRLRPATYRRRHRCDGHLVVVGGSPASPEAPAPHRMIPRSPGLATSTQAVP